MGFLIHTNKWLKSVIKTQNGYKHQGCLIKLYSTGQVDEILTSSHKLSQILAGYSLPVNLHSLMSPGDICDTFQTSKVSRFKGNLFEQV